MALDRVGDIKQIFKIPIPRMLYRGERSPDQQAGRACEAAALLQADSARSFPHQQVPSPRVTIHGSGELSPGSERRTQGTATDVVLDQFQTPWVCCGRRVDHPRGVSGRIP